MLNSTFCLWMDELRKVCTEQLKLTEYDATLKLDEAACLNSFTDGMTPYQCFREPHFNS